MAGFSAVVEVSSQLAGLPGWRRSADRTGLYADSLLTGNFTGNSANLGRLQPESPPEMAMLQ